MLNYAVFNTVYAVYNANINKVIKNAENTPCLGSKMLILSNYAGYAV